MNSKYQPREKININKIFFEDSFIELINELSNTIYEYYHKSLPLLAQSSNIFQIFEKNINEIIPLSEIDNNNNIYYNKNNHEISTYLNDFKKEFISILKKVEENLKLFIEKSKTIFKEMKEKKNAKVEEIYNDYANNKKNEDKNKEFNSPNVDPLRLSHLSKTSSGSQNAKRERNKTNNKISSINKNNSSFKASGLKNLVSQMSKFTNIISNHSNEAKENYIKLQKQILYEINKILNVNSSKSAEKKNVAKTNTISVYNTNSTLNSPFIMVNNNNNNNVTMTTTNNNSYYNIINKDNLKEIKSPSSNRNSKLENYISSNNDLKNENNNLKTHLEELKIENKNLEKKIEELNNNIDIIKKSEKNKLIKYKTDYEMKNKTLENQNNELKNKCSLLIKKLENNDQRLDGNAIDMNPPPGEIKKLKEEIENNKIEYEQKIQKLNEEMNKDKKEIEQKLKKLNDENTSLSKFLADKNREIQILQNSNKLKINELNKLKLIVKNNEKQLKVKKLKADQQKASNSPNGLKIKDLLAKSKPIYESNDVNTNPQNLSANNDQNSNDKEIIKKLEIENSQLKKEMEKIKEEKENLSSNISLLEKDISITKNEKENLENELIDKNNEIINENKIVDDLKSEKDKLLHKLKEYKSIQESNISQILILKNQIKEMERQQKNLEISDPNTNKKYLKKKELKKRINELEIEKSNIKMQLEIELKNNSQLENEVKLKTEQIEGLNIVINKLMAEKESYTMSLNSSKSHIKDNKFNRTKTNIEESKLKQISNNNLNIRHIMELKKGDNNFESSKDRNYQEQKFPNKRKTDKNLEIYKLNENDSNKKNDGNKSEDLKFEYSKIK